jgi:hypothetical protein
MQRSHLVTGDEGHYSGVVAELEARGAKVVPVFAGEAAVAVAVTGGGGVEDERGSSSSSSSGCGCSHACCCCMCRPHCCHTHPHTTPHTPPGGLDFSAPVKKFFYDPLGSGKAFVDTVVSLTGV